MSAQHLEFLNEYAKLDVFDNIAVNELVSWSQFEIMCTLKNIPIDRNLVWSLACGTKFCKNLFNILIDAIKTANFLNEYVNDAEFIAMMFKVYSVDAAESSTKYHAMMSWHKFCCNLNYSNAGAGIELNMSNEADEAMLYELSTALDNRFPLLMIQFYEKYGRQLHYANKKYVMWIFRRCKIKAEHSKLFSNIFHAMQNKFYSIERTDAYMN